jgi:two-component system, NtrC family, sensor kinase
MVKKAGPQEIQSFRYRRLWMLAAFTTSVVTMAALLVLNGVNYHQFERSLESEYTIEVESILALTGETLERTFGDRLAALRLVAQTHTHAELRDRKTLSSILKSLRHTFGDFTGLELRDSDDEVTVAVGGRVPDLDFEHPVGTVAVVPGEGHRFSLAVRSEDEEGQAFRLLAAVDADLLTRIVEEDGETAAIYTVLVNADGFLQTPSRYCGGKVLEPCVRKLPDIRDRSAVFADLDEQGDRLFWGYGLIPNSPFVVVVLVQPSLGTRSYFYLRGELLLFTIGGGLLLLALNVGTATWLIGKLRTSEIHQSQLLHKAQYTTKMASLGRLAAGVAHEINNPLAIINEKAGLIKDYTALAKEDFPRREQVVTHLDSVLHSVERCRAITHRLLGFARRMDVEKEPVELDRLLEQVLSFLETEAMHRSVEIVRSFPDAPTFIESDQGQLQQVFLNILNNAFEATPEGGKIEIILRIGSPGFVEVLIRDDGRGIDQTDLRHIFEPFYTTKGKYGTGLGLSITYGIVTNLGGEILVESELGEGTCFTVVLPIGAVDGEVES